MHRAIDILSMIQWEFKNFLNKEMNEWVNKKSQNEWNSY